MGTNPYGKIDTASTDSKYAFFEQVGTHIITIDEWVGRDARDGIFCDICNVTVVKTLMGDGSAVGQMRCRLRKADKDGMWANEAKQRVVVALTAATRAATGDSDFVYEAKNATGDVLKSIHDKNGANVAGYPIKVQIDPPKPGKVFKPATYSIPTEADLEGVTLDESGRVVK